MLSFAWKKTLIVAAFAGASIMLSADVADAGWGSWGSSGGSSGSSGGSWGSSGGSWGSSGGSSGGYVVRSGSWGSSGGSSGGSWGVHRWRPFRHWHAKRHYRAYHSSGSSGGSWGSHGSSGGSHGSHGSSGGVYYSAPVEYQDAPAVPEAPAEPQARAARDGSVTLAINVPVEAKVFINGAETDSTGEDRVYVSKGLATGKRYRYTVRAEVERDGKTIVKEESVVLTAGGRSQIAMNFDSATDNVAEKSDSEDNNPRTTLKVQVPEDAKVSVLGVESNQSGETRYFHTDQLSNGQTWNGYTVKAVVVRNGQPIELEKQVTLTGGNSQQIAFDFAAAELASRVSQATR